MRWIRRALRVIPDRINSATCYSRWKRSSRRAHAPPRCPGGTIARAGESDRSDALASYAQMACTTRLTADEAAASSRAHARAACGRRASARRPSPRAPSQFPATLRKSNLAVRGDGAPGKAIPAEPAARRSRSGGCAWRWPTRARLRARAFSGSGGRACRLDEVGRFAHWVQAPGLRATGCGHGRMATGNGARRTAGTARSVVDHLQSRARSVDDLQLGESCLGGRWRRIRIRVRVRVGEQRVSV